MTRNLRTIPTTTRREPTPVPAPVPVSKAIDFTTKNVPITGVEQIVFSWNPSLNKRYVFQNYANLRNKYIMYFDVNLTPFMMFDGSIPFITSTDVLKNMYLVLSSGNKEVINRISLYQLRVMRNQNCPLLINRIVDWGKSYIEYDGVYSSGEKSISISVLFNENPAPFAGYYTELLKIDIGKAPKFIHYLNLQQGITRQIVRIIPSMVGTAVSGTPFEDFWRPYTRFTFVDKVGREIIAKYPMTELSIDNSRDVEQFNVLLNWEKSYVEFSQIVGSAPVNGYVYLTVIMK